MTSRPADDTPDRLVVGLVRGVQGLGGTVRVEVLSDRPERFEPGSTLFREGEESPLTVIWRSADGPGLLLRFKEVTTREQATALHDIYLEAEIGDRALADDAVWWHELEGVAVKTREGEPLGVVEDVFRSGGGEVLVITGGRRGEVLVPVVSSIVVDFAPREGRIVVDGEALGLEPERVRRPRGRRSSRAASSRSSPNAGPTEAAE
ncbi:MAG: ribosome maturation factor RimM [Candidatus Limnocylindrales bacterium]